MLVGNVAAAHERLAAAPDPVPGSASFPPPRYGWKKGGRIRVVRNDPYTLDRRSDGHVR